jgi:hypothetical protein
MIIHSFPSTFLRLGAIALLSCFSLSLAGHAQVKVQLVQEVEVPAQDVEVPAQKEPKSRTSDRILRKLAGMSELELQQLDSQLNSQIEGLANQIENEVRVIPKENEVGEKPVLVILGATEFTIGIFNGAQRTLQVTPATYYRQLGGALTSYEKNRNFFVYFFRPSACQMEVTNVPGRNGVIKKNLFALLCDPKNNLTRMLGFKYGFEPINEEATVLFTDKTPDVQFEKQGESIAGIWADPEKGNFENLGKEERASTLEKNVARLEQILKHRELSLELKKKASRKVSLPQQKDTKKKPFPVIVAHGKMYPLVKFGIGKIYKNEDGLTWSQTADRRFQLKVDPNGGVDPMNEQNLEQFLSSVRNAPRSVRQSFFLNLFVFSDSESFGVFNKIRDEAVLRDLDYNWLPISELPLMLKADTVPWKTQ